MKLGLFTDSVPNLPLEDALDLARQAGCQTVEIATGGQSSSPHLRLDDLLVSAPSRDRLMSLCRERDLEIAALNCSAWPLHPVVGPTHEELIHDTIRLAGMLGVETVVTMSGTPGDGVSATTFNWIWYPWPSDALELLARQWGDALAYWERTVRVARDHGVRRIAFELHPLHLVYNVPTLQRMRDAIGPELGANVDPSHLIWQGMSPPQVVRALGPAVHYVHLKDTEIRSDRVGIAGVLDQGPFDDPNERAWNFRAFGQAHGLSYWTDFRDALDEVGYAGAVSIENEDATFPDEDGVLIAAEFARDLFELPAGPTEQLTVAT